WDHRDRRIYEEYDRLFNIRQQGMGEYTEFPVKHLL
ncbi:MAG: hypothetical protein PWQ22_1665, partial [Archaeoglobaceae archaeon]|nr:hypothetical protein [Archaeoglobaceae archaeon]